MKRTVAIAMAAASVVFAPALAQQPGPSAQVPVAAPPATKAGTIEKLTGVWVEGPGFDIKYGANYDTCAERCLANARCVMIEYYRPEKKCNLYDTVRPRLKGGSSFVGIRKPATP